MGKTAEQEARDLLERLEHPRAQELTAGDVVELANLLSARRVSIEMLEQLIAKWREKADDLERMHLHPQAKLTRDRADDLEALTRQETEK